MPARRKPPGTRQGHRPSSDLELVTPIAAKALPKPPALPRAKKLLAETVRSWNAFWSSELAQLVQDVDAQTALSRLFRMYDSRERFERIVLGAPMVQGSMGQVKVNPAAAEVASLDARIAGLEDRFGITPMARLKLGITFGAAQRSIEDLNRGFDDADEDDEETDRDPRVIDVEEA